MRPEDLKMDDLRASRIYDMLRAVVDADPGQHAAFRAAVAAGDEAVPFSGADGVRMIFVNSHGAWAIGFDSGMVGSMTEGMLKKIGEANGHLFRLRHGQLISAPWRPPGPDPTTPSRDAGRPVGPVVANAAADSAAGKVRKKLMVDSAADLLELAGDVAAEIRRRHEAVEEESWIGDDLDLQGRVFIAQAIALASGLKATSGMTEDQAERVVRRELAELQRKTQEGFSVVPGLAPPLAGPMGRLRVLRGRLDDEAAEYSDPLGPNPVIVAIRRHGGAYMVERVGSPPAFTLCGDKDAVLRTVKDMMEEPDAGKERGTVEKIP
jgi:hypothetical protein